MAILICDTHSQGRDEIELPAAVEPIGYPKTAAICFVEGCEDPGWIWLSQDELDAFRAGQRVFVAFTAHDFMKVKAK